MKKLSFILSVMLCFILLLILGCSDESSGLQFRNCFTDYSDNHAACNGNESCESQAAETFRSCIGNRFIFPIHFVIMTDQLTGSDASIEGLMRDQIDTLNRYFTEEDSAFPPDNRRRIVTFSYKSTTFYQEALNMGGATVDFLTPNFDFDDRHDFQSLFNAENRSRLRDPNAINIYIVDAQNTSNSHAKNNSNRPYIFLDYARINGDANRVGVQEHEMGHCFLLDHECIPSASSSSSTNFMASAGDYQDNADCMWTGGVSTVDCSESGGTRDLGLDACQTQVVLDVAMDIFSTLGLTL